MKTKIKKSNYKSSWLLECSEVDDRPIAEKYQNIRWCLEVGADANARSSGGSSALHAATRRTEACIVRTLLQHKADVNTTDHNGETPLHLALRYGDGTAHVLEPVGPEGTATYGEDDTPQPPVAQKKVSIVDMLLGVNTKTNIRDSSGDTSLHVAVRSGEAFVVNRLLHYAADANIKNSTGDTPLHLAAHRGEVPIVDALLNHSAGVNTSNSTYNTPLHLAAHRGEASIVEKLLNLGAKVNMKNIDGDTPLHLAIRGGKTKIVNLLLKRGAEVNARNNVGLLPLHAAADGGKKEIVDMLLNSGADLNVPNNSGDTSLHLAVLRGQAATVVLLLNRGVDVNIKNAVGDTSLYLAVVHGDPSIVELLLRYRADANITSSVGNAPLHVAAYLGRSLIVDLLLNSKADVNITDTDGNTALHLAARRQHVNVVRMLLHHNADVTIRNSDFNTPLTVARILYFEGNAEIVSLLQNAEKPLGPVVIPNDEGSQHSSDISLSDVCNQVAIPNNNLQTDTELTFSKRPDSSGLAGQLYETKMLCLVLIRALNDKHIEDFLLGTNISDVGDMDDICLRYQVKGQTRPVVLFVQAKHREDRDKGRLTVDDVRSSSGAFSLRKYFESYLAIKDRFQVNNKDPMFDGHFSDVECNLIIYTTAKDCFTKKKTKHTMSTKVDYLINTADKTNISTEENTEVFQYDYDEDDIEILTKMIVIERFKISGVFFLEKIMSKKDKTDMILMDKLIAKYHVVMGREVLRQCKEQQANQKYRLWEFRPQFFESKCEYLAALRKTFVKELSTKCCDQSNITEEDITNFKLVLQNQCAGTISKLIGKLATYNAKTKKLQLAEVKAFKNKFKTDEYKTFLLQFNEIKTSENVITEAIKIKLASMKIKLPLSFGNLDMTFRGQNRINYVANKLIELLKNNVDTMILDINEDIVGQGKTIEPGVIDINGGIGSGVGNLLVVDLDTKLLKFDLDNETLPNNAALFLKELKNKVAHEELSRYRIKIDVNGFPKDSFSGDEYGERLAKEFLSKLWFYTNQASQDEVETIVKNDIDKYYNNENDAYQVKFKIHSDAIFRSAHDMVQVWWKQGSEANYLTKNNDYFQTSKLNSFNDLLLTVMNHIYQSNFQSIDFKFNPRIHQNDDTCIQAPKALGIVFGQKFRMFEKQNKRINTEGNQKIMELVHYAEKLANCYVAASSEPHIVGNILNSKEIQENIIINILQNNVNHEFKANKFKYSKRSGTSEVSGQLYETNLLCLVLLRACNSEQIEDFILGTNIYDIGDMDDVCLRYQVRGQKRPVGLFLQAKHKEKGILTVEDMRNPAGDFSLRKYFESYLKIRNRFRTNNENAMFQGDFGDIDWHFIIYTPASGIKIKKKEPEQKVCETVHVLINTNNDTKGFQFEHNKSDINLLTKVLALERLKNLGMVFLEFILFEPDNLDVIMADKLIAQYHLVLRREVLQLCKIQQGIVGKDVEYRLWEFSSVFLKKYIDCEYLNTLNKTFVNELSRKCWDQYRITDRDRDNFKHVLQNPCAYTISKLIGKLAIYNLKTKKLQLVADFKKELISNSEFKMLAEQFNEIETDENVIDEAIQIRLKTMTFKLPLSFGNVDMAFSTKDNDTKEKITTEANKFVNLFELYKDTKVIDINDVVVSGKTTEQDIDIYSCIQSAFGNLLILDPDTKMLKLDLDNEALPKNAALLLQELKEKFFNEELHSYRIKVNIDTLPKDSFYGDEYDEIHAVDFLSKLWFYADQVKEDQVKCVLIYEINLYFSKIGQHCNSYFFSLPDLIYSKVHENTQKWSMQTSQSPYLTRKSAQFERAKDNEIANLLETVINFMMISNTASLDITFQQGVSKYFKFVKMHQLFNSMIGTLFCIFDPNFNDSINIELPQISEPLPYSNYSSLGELMFSLEIHHRMEWVAMKMWTVSSYTEYFLLAKAGPAIGSRRARDGFLLQQLCNGHIGHMLEGERNPNDNYSNVNN